MKSHNTNQSAGAVLALRVYDLDTYDGSPETREEYLSGAIPPKHQWAFDHITRQDCGSLSMGMTVYEVITR